ncbi:MAG: class I SAM-dependent methyltransferase, partial [Gammaproteobacteria bacterium]|nr:class I SAM-dependent methyltransferase [Gammaproteobacteria bacterium]
FCRAAAGALPFAADAFDCALIGFGLRNFTDKQAALGEIRRVLEPGGVLLVLEFSKPLNPVLEGLSTGWQSFWPAVGRLVAGDSGSYRYLVESIRRHPPQEALKLMMEDARFAEVEYHNLLGGVVAVHRAVA